MAKKDNTSTMVKYLNKSILGAIVYFVLVIAISIILSKLSDKPTDAYQTLAVAVIIGWIMLVVSYFIWAIYFYNVNMGWTDEDWEANAEQKKVTPELAETEPDKNPNNEETMGLPAGTIRGTIALSMLVAGLAMTIASLSMDSTVPPDSVFIDNFEFFKTAFLMMIAFYFGTKSLEVLDRTRVFRPKDKAEPEPAAETPAAKKDAPAAPATPAADKAKDVHLPEDNMDDGTPADLDTAVPEFHDATAKG